MPKHLQGKEVLREHKTLANASEKTLAREKEVIMNIIR